MRRAPAPSLRPDGLAPRRAALSLYRAVIADGQLLDEAFAHALARGPLASLSPRDRAFARRLATTGLRRRGQASALLARFLNKGGLQPKAVELESILVLGVTELTVLATPAHAALDCAVSLAREDAKTAGFAGLVNAVLRRVTREVPSLETFCALAPPRLNLPDWLGARWSSHYGASRMEAMAAAIAEEPPLDFTVKGDPEAWLTPLEAALLPTGSLRRALGGRIETLPGYAEGVWWVQDAAAAMPVKLLGAIAGHDVLDLCAAPGGKTAQLAAAGAKVIALDKDPRRLARLAENLKRLSLTANLVESDARTWRPPAPLRFVLLDAPCTATGTLRRHPDALWLKKPRDVATLSGLQAELLDAASLMLAPGGTLVYSVCSLEPEEGEAQIESVLARHPELARAPVGEGEFSWAAPFLTSAGDLRTAPDAWPEHGGLDGFFVARLIRQA